MNELSVLRADYYSDGAIVPILISFPDGSSEHITAVQSIRWFSDGKECFICCLTQTKKITLRFSDSKWKIVHIDS